MKMKIEFEGNIFTDREEIENIIDCHKNAGLLMEAQECIRQRLKNGENVNDEEEKFLKYLWDIITDA